MVTLTQCYQFIQLEMILLEGNGVGDWLNNNWFNICHLENFRFFVKMTISMSVEGVVTISGR